jgi:regulatory protein YycH of two-component signal transduction system YycFG
MTRVLTAKRSNTYIHGIGKINTKHKYELNNNILRETTRSRDRELIRSELRLRSYDFIEDLRD